MVLGAIEELVQGLVSELVGDGEDGMGRKGIENKRLDLGKIKVVALV
jgi:hypothetical protein